MHYLKDFVKKYNIDNQLPNYKVTATDDRIFIDGTDYRLDLYGWPDNRVVASNKLNGQHTIKRFGPKGTTQCRDYYLTCLGALGVETPDAEFDPIAFAAAIKRTLCSECKEA